MKKLILIIAVIAYTGRINAQENITDFRDILTFGIKIGTNYSNVYHSEGEAFVTNSKFGLAGGMFVSIPFDKYIGIQPEVLFSQKGFRATGMLLGNSYGLTRTTSYLDVPIYFALKPSEFITLLAGPQFSYLLIQKDVIKNGTNSLQQEQEFENDNVRKHILCIAGGADITLKRMVLSARVGWDMQKNNRNGTSATPRYKNVWYQFTLGYRLY